MPETLAMTGEANATGELSVRVFRGPDPFDPPADWEDGDPLPTPTPPAMVAERPDPEDEPEADWTPPVVLKVTKAPFWWRVRNTLRMIRSGELFIPVLAFLLRRLLPRGFTLATAELYGDVYRGKTGVMERHFLGRHLIVTSGKAYIASCFDNTAEPENAKYHGAGTGTTSAAAGDTALQTELTTQYAVDNTRPTGSQAHSGATYTTVGSVAPDSGGTIAVTEWGLFTAASSTTLIDHQVFSAVNLVAANGDSVAFTYVLTIG